VICKVIYVAAFFAWAIALIQKTPFAFLSTGATNAAFGFAVGISIGAAITWFTKAGTT
jgi:hypothetical protein